jgi:hypothetical protein
LHNASVRRVVDWEGFLLMVNSLFDSIFRFERVLCQDFSALPSTYRRTVALEFDKPAKKFSSRCSVEVLLR